MKNFIRELRRRHVFRAAGLYAGAAWIALEGADILLPAFDAPEWIFRGLIIVAFVGFPVALILAWVYELTERGLERESDLSEEQSEARHRKGRQLDFAVIGVLAVALGISLYGNFRGVVEIPIGPISVLVADFDDQTNDPLFQGTLEQALIIGAEEAPFVTSYSRANATKIAQEIGTRNALDEEGARLVAVREGIKLVLSGSVIPEGSSYSVNLRAVDPTNGKEISKAKRKAKSKSEVLGSVGLAAQDIRKDLGDTNTDGSHAGLETFTAASLEAVQNYVKAQDLARAGKDEEAVTFYRAAVTEDVNFGRAYSGLALSAYKLGRKDEADAAWERALGLLDGMTEREKYRTLGVYYSLVAGNFTKAIENYATLVELYPADSAGHNNLAVAHFLTLDFDEAQKEGGKILEIYPNKTLYRANYALYASTLR